VPSVILRNAERRERFVFMGHSLHRRWPGGQEMFGLPSPPRGRAQEA